MMSEISILLSNTGPPSPPRPSKEALLTLSSSAERTIMTITTTSTCKEQELPSYYDQSHESYLSSNHHHDSIPTLSSSQEMTMPQSILPQSELLGPLSHSSNNNNNNNDDDDGNIDPNNQNHTSTTRNGKLKLLPLAILVFYNVAGGPFGIEPSLHAAGNLYTIIGFLIVPFVWSIPEALITAELGSVFCHDGSGGVAWVDEAFGEKWGLVCGYLSWISGATDNAIYPTLFLHYVISVLHSNNSDNGEITFWFDNGYARFSFISVLSILLGLLNYRGLEIVGNASVVVCVIAMSPFVIMVILGIPKIDPSRWLQLPDCNVTMFSDDDEFVGQYGHDSNCDTENYRSSFIDSILGGGGGVLWTPFLNNMFWNFNSFDAASNFAGEVNSVSTTYPKGIFLGLMLSIVFYLIPLLVVTGSTNYKQYEWVDGQLGKAAIDLGGNMLGTWIVFAAGISNLALFEAELSSDSYQLMGMAERGHLPKVFATRSKFGTPTVGIFVGIIVIIVMSMADFTQLVELLNFNYAIALLMEYAAFVKLRWTRKDLQRPYRIPIPDWFALPMVFPPMLGIFVVFAVASWTTYIFILFVFVLGIVSYYFLHLSKLRNWFTFVDTNINGAHCPYESVNEID